MVCGGDGAEMLYSQMTGHVQRQAALWVCRRCYTRITLFLFIIGDEGIESVPTPRHPQWVNPWHRLQGEGEATERWGAGEDG